MTVSQIVKKLVILCILLAAAITTVVTKGSVITEKTLSSNGSTLIRLVNSSPNRLYCWISYDGGYFDFYINGYSQSRWYYEPRGYYQWTCE